MPRMKYAFDGITVYFLLVVMVGAFIPVLRFFEHRWDSRSGHDPHDPSLRGAFRRDQVGLWLMTIGVPLPRASESHFRTDGGVIPRESRFITGG